MQQPNTEQQLPKRQKATFGFVFSVVGAILILLRGLVTIIAGDLITFAGSDVVRHRLLAGLALNIIGGIAVVFAVLVIIGAYQIYIGMEMTGGLFVLIFSTLSIFVGSGWIVGLILGIVGGILAMVKK